MTPAPELSYESISFQGSDNAYVLGAYYPSWKIYKGEKPSDLRIKELTHVYYAFARMQEDGTVTSLDTKADLQLPVDDVTGCVAALRKHRQEHNPKCRLILSIGGGSGSNHFAAIAGSKAKTKQFCETARQMVDSYGFDGVDIDWEHPDTPAKGADFVGLMESLRAHLPRPRYTITAALPAGEWCLRNIDLPALLRPTRSGGPVMNLLKPKRSGDAVMDFVNIMAYDFAGSWTDGQSGHQASLHPPKRPHNAYAKRSISGIVEYLTHDRKIDHSRVIIGIPIYGRSFLGVCGPGEKFTGVGGDASGTVDYRSLPLPGAAEIVDNAIGAASCDTGAEGWITYDNPDTVKMKAKFVAAKGLGGVFFWTGSFDSPDQNRSLIHACHDILSGSS